MVWRGMRDVSQERSCETVAFGPEVPGWGSWDWVGADVAHELANYYDTVVWRDSIPDCDVLFVVKHALSEELIEQASRRAHVIYCPVDYYGSAADIDADAPMLRRCARVVLHCARLRRYFEPYCVVETMDHHVKFAAPRPGNFRSDGFVLWVGVHSNLPPLVEWLSRHPLPTELVVLTNLEAPVARPVELGFPAGAAVRLERWSPEAHRERTAAAKAALDIKGDDFRQRHKPPAKAIDFLASGLPLALNPGTSVGDYLARLGFPVPSPLETERWFSREYWEETNRFGAALAELLSLRRIGLRYRRIIEEIVAQR